MLTRKYYYNFEDICNLEILSVGWIAPYESQTLKFICDEIGVSPTTLPFTLTDSYVEGLWQRVVSRYYDDYVLAIKKYCNEPAPDQEELAHAFVRWIEKLLTFIAQTYDHYATLLGFYASEKADLMEDIKATSKNNVKFNDTPQNPNSAGVYEGDDYITHFTKTEGETSSPLMSKMMRLKEIQDHFKNLWADWVEEAEKLFIEGSNL